MDQEAQRVDPNAMSHQERIEFGVYQTKVRIQQRLNEILENLDRLRRSSEEGQAMAKGLLESLKGDPAGWGKLTGATAIGIRPWYNAVEIAADLKASYEALDILKDQLRELADLRGSVVTQFDDRI